MSDSIFHCHFLMMILTTTSNYFSCNLYSLSTGEVHSPSPKAKSESHVMKSRFDSDPESESESEEETRAKDVQLPSLAQRRGYSGYHDTVSSDEEHSEMSDTERPEEDRAGDKESKQ